MTTTDQTLFQSEDLQRLLKAAEATSSIKSVELIKILEAHAFDPIDAGQIDDHLGSRRNRH